jgi:hypothetical protein
MITLSALEINSTYSFFLILIWDWSNLDSEIADTYGGNKISNIVTINLSKQIIYTSQINHLSAETISEIEKTTEIINFPYLVILINLITAVLLFQKRK